MKRDFRSLFACSAVFAAVAAPALADPACQPVAGRFEASVVPPGTGHCPVDPNAFCTAGRVWGGIQGNYQFVMTGAIPASALGGGPTVLFFTGRSDVALKDGDHLLGTDTGSLDLPPGLGGFASLITWTGGTGAMHGATGQIRLGGEFDPVAGTTRGDYRGTVCSDQ